VEAAVRGTVSASFVVEHFGALTALAFVSPAERRSRSEAVRDGVIRTHDMDETAWFVDRLLRGTRAQG
jgi:hypothetical protein